MIDIIPPSIRRSARGSFAIPAVITVLLSIAGCTADTQRSQTRSSEPPSVRPVPAATAPTSSSQGASSPTAAEAARIQITIGSTVLTGRLSNSATARDLIAQLPLTLTFSDLNNVEKIARLPRGLSMEGVPRGDDPQPGDIGYYAPARDLVFYYGDVGYFDGIVRIGRFDSSTDVIRDQTGRFSATIELEN